MLTALKSHWPEYLSEAAGLGLFMVSACVFGALLFHPGSPVAQSVPDGISRRLVMGLGMGLTAIALIYSPWGRRSGAHLNPATTLTFWRLGKIAGPDAAWYVSAQALGGLAGVLVTAAIIGPALGDPAVRYVTTVPGASGVGPAFLAEVAITFILMTVVLNASNTARWAACTGIFAGALVATYITLEAPVSGMSMNPARTLASAVPAAVWDALWIYFLAPPLGMLLAAELFVRRQGLSRVFCAKLHHDSMSRCIFRCRFGELQAERTTTTPAAAVARPSA
jgi:aquaporin Z